MVKKRIVVIWLLIFIVASTGIFIGRWSVTSVSAEEKGMKNSDPSRKSCPW
jgi:hypothetical protein